MLRKEMRQFIKESEISVEFSIKYIMNTENVSKEAAIEKLLKDKWGIEVKDLDQEIEKTRKNLEELIRHDLRLSAKEAI